MRKFISWLIFLPILVIGVVFAVTHREPVFLKVPFVLEGGIEIPLFLIGFGGLLVGVVWAFIMAYIGFGPKRRQFREAGYRADQAEIDARKLKARVDELEAEKTAAKDTPGNSLVPASGTSPSRAA